MSASDIAVHYRTISAAGRTTRRGLLALRVARMWERFSVAGNIAHPTRSTARGNGRDFLRKGGTITGRAQSWRAPPHSGSTGFANRPLRFPDLESVSGSTAR